MSETKLWGLERLRSALRKSDVLWKNCVPVDHTWIDTTRRRASVTRAIESPLNQDRLTS